MSGYYETLVLGIGVATILGVSMNVLIFLLQTKRDLISWLGFLYVIGLAMLGLGIGCLVSHSQVSIQSQIKYA